MEQQIIARLEEMERKYRNLKISFAGIISLTFIALAGFAFRPKAPAEIIRARGIVIEDSAGRDRILIGSPIPYSKSRIRTDTALVRKYWAKNFPNPDQYMKWYGNYSNSAEGIVIMNDKGFDRLQVGDHLSDPNIGKRMFEAAGMIWNDAEGWERGGAGVNTTEDGKSRSVVGLDDKGGEAVHLVALEDGTKGLMISGTNGHLMIGMSDKNGDWFQNKDEFVGVKYFDTKGKLIWDQQVNPAKALKQKARK